MWAAVGVQGALLSALGVGPIRIDALVVGGVPADQRTQVATEVERAIGGRLGDWDWQGARSKTPAVAFTDLVFGGARDGIAQAEGIEEAEVVSCPECSSSSNCFRLILANSSPTKQLCPTSRREVPRYS